MALIRYRLDAENAYVDDVANTVAITLIQQTNWDDNTQEPKPPGVTTGYTVSYPSVTLTAPIKKNTAVTNLVFAQYIYTPLPTGGTLTTFVRWEQLANGSWVNKGPCNRDGSQPVV